MLNFEYRFSNQLFEALQNRPDILKRLETELILLKSDLQNKTIISNIEDIIKEFAHINHVKLTIENKWRNIPNASILGIPKINPLMAKLTEISHILLSKKVSPEIVMRDLEEDIPLYLDKVYLFLSPKLFDDFNEKEIIAIILHEIGHLYNHDFSIFQYWVNIIVLLINKTMYVGSVITLLLHGIPAFGLFTVSIFLFTRTLTFYEHKCEYDADKYPIKYGYGDDFINVLKKFEKFSITNTSSNKFVKKTLSILINLLFPSTHPTSVDRIRSVVKIIRKDYCNQYKELDDKIISITNEYI